MIDWGLALLQVPTVNHQQREAKTSWTTRYYERHFLSGRDDRPLVSVLGSVDRSRHSGPTRFGQKKVKFSILIYSITERMAAPIFWNLGYVRYDGRRMFPFLLGWCVVYVRITTASRLTLMTSSRFGGICRDKNGRSWSGWVWVSSFSSPGACGLDGHCCAPGNARTSRRGCRWWINDSVCIHAHSRRCGFRVVESIPFLFSRSFVHAFLCVGQPAERLGSRMWMKRSKLLVTQGNSEENPVRLWDKW